MGFTSLGRRLAVVLAITLTGQGCSDDPTGPQVIEQVAFAESLDIDLDDFTRSASGLYVQDVVVGEGAGAESGDTLDLEYEGWLTDGVRFDAGGFQYIIDLHGVIAGFREGMIGVREGGVRRLIIPPELGYGEAGDGPIPGGAVLVFRVTVVELKN